MIDTLSQREIDSLVDELVDKKKENKRLKKKIKRLQKENSNVHVRAQLLPSSWQDIRDTLEAGI